MTVPQSWFWQAIEPQVSGGGAPVSEVLVTLMEEAVVGDGHRQQLRNLLEWLRYIGLISIADDSVTLADRSPASGLPAASDEEAPVSHQVEQGPAGAEVSESTSGQTEPAPVLVFDFALHLTADDLARLTPDQIKAVFEAVGTVVAIKNSR